MVMEPTRIMLLKVILSSLSSSSKPSRRRFPLFDPLPLLLHFKAIFNINSYNSQLLLSSSSSQSLSCFVSKP